MEKQQTVKTEVETATSSDLGPGGSTGGNIRCLSAIPAEVEALLAEIMEQEEQQN